MERQEDLQTGDFHAKAREGAIIDTLRIWLHRGKYPEK